MSKFAFLNGETIVVPPTIKNALLWGPIDMKLGWVQRVVTDHGEFQILAHGESGPANRRCCLVLTTEFEPMKIGDTLILYGKLGNRELRYWAEVSRVPDSSEYIISVGRQV